MFTSLKRIGFICLLSSVANCLSAVLVYLYYAGISGLSFQNKVTMLLALVSIPVLFISVTVALYTTYSDLSVMRQSQYEEITALRKRIDELERKTSI